MDILKRFEQKGYKLVAMKVRQHADAYMGVNMP
jgi:nucleoside diphosphate kinase